MSLPDFLIDRYIVWRKQNFKDNRKTYQKAVSETQKPKAMVISCCDSRVNPTSIFGGNIGEFFIHRNIANLVPSYSSDTKHFGTLAAIEYAVKTLKVPNIIVLGHSNCGGIQYGYESSHEKKDNSYEFVDQWLEITKPVFQNLNLTNTGIDKIDLIEKESIKNSIKNLKTFPFIKNLLEQKKISINGLWYDIANGILMELNSDKNKFEKINYE